MIVQAGVEWVWPLRCNDGMSHGWLAWQGAYLTNTEVISGIDCHETRSSFFPRKHLHCLHQSCTGFSPHLHLSVSPQLSVLMLMCAHCTECISSHYDSLSGTGSMRTPTQVLGVGVIKQKYAGVIQVIEPSWVCKKCGTTFKQTKEIT